MDWFRTLMRDLISGLLIWGFLEALVEIDPLWGRSLAVLFTATDYIIYLAKGYNFVNWIWGMIK